MASNWRSASPPSTLGLGLPANSGHFCSGIDAFGSVEPPQVIIVLQPVGDVGEVDAAMIERTDWRSLIGGVTLDAKEACVLQGQFAADRGQIGCESGAGSSRARETVFGWQSGRERFGIGGNAGIRAASQGRAR